MYINPYRRFVSACIPNWLMPRREVSRGAKHFYARLCQHAGQAGYCFPSEQLLADELGVSVRTIRRYVAELVRHKLVEVKQRGQGKTNLYFFLYHAWMGDEVQGAAPAPEMATTPLRARGRRPVRQPRPGRTVRSAADNHVPSRPDRIVRSASKDEVNQGSESAADPAAVPDGGGSADAQQAAERMKRIAIEPAVADRLARKHPPLVVDAAIAKATRNAIGSPAGYVVRLLNSADFLASTTKSPPAPAKPHQASILRTVLHGEV